jgi:hypothetical protein
LGFSEVIRKRGEVSLILAFAGLGQSNLQHQVGYSLLSLVYADLIPAGLSRCNAMASLQWS